MGRPHKRRRRERLLAMPEPDRPAPQSHPEQPWVLLDDGDAGINDLLSERNHSTDDRLRTGDTLIELRLDNDQAPAALTAPPQTYEPMKRDTSKVGFFDLPPELRLQVCSLISDRLAQMYDDQPLPHENIKEGRLMLVTTRWLEERHRSRLYRDRCFLALQLVTRKFRTEFLTTWAENSTHHCQVQLDFWRPGKTRIVIRSEQLAFGIWKALRDYFQNLQGRLQVARDVRHIGLYLNFKAVLNEQPRDMLTGFSGNMLARHLERLDASLVHQELLVEVQILCTHHLDGAESRNGGYEKYRRARRSFVLRQNAPARRDQE